jgi:ABC-type multidrug transport system fused ATPase/permease subunit
MMHLDRMFQYIRPRPRAWAVGLLYLVGTLAGPVVGPQVMRHVFDGLSHGITRTTLLEYAAVLVVIGAATGVSRFFMRQALMGASREVEHDIRGHIFAQLTCGCRRRSTTSSDCSSCSFQKESRSTEIDLIEPP